MRLLVALLVTTALAVGALALVRDEGRAELGAVTLVGDSLNVGTEPYLRDALRGWTIDAHDRVGRATAEGVEELRSLGGRLAPVVVVSLGTNDADGTEAGFRRLVEQAVAIVGPGRCLVWATIVRDGVARDPFDSALREASAAHGNVRLVEWARMVSEGGSLLAADSVHGTPDGYARRAEETARVVRSCP